MAGEVVAWIVSNPRVNRGQREAQLRCLSPESAAVGWQGEPLVLHSDYAALARDRDELHRELGELHMHAKGRDEYAVQKAGETLRAIVERNNAESDRDRLREALELFLKAGVGNSTDFDLQCDATREARAALAGRGS